jgi:osmotically-inducible protein OsmY
MPMVKRLVLMAAWLALVGCATTEDVRSAEEQIGDTVTLSRVKAALLSSDDTDGTRIDVDVFRGRVRLDGAVASQAERKAATRVAEGIEGVRSVRNNLELLPPSP